MPFDGATTTIPHARDDAPWSGPSKAWFPDTWGTLFALRLGPDNFALYYDRACQRHFARHASPEEIASGSVIQSGRRFDVCAGVSQ
jgi:hypothetical protein